MPLGILENLTRLRGCTMSGWLRHSLLYRMSSLYRKRRLAWEGVTSLQNLRTMLSCELWRFFFCYLSSWRLGGCLTDGMLRLMQMLRLGEWHIRLIVRDSRNMSRLL